MYHPSMRRLESVVGRDVFSRAVCSRIRDVSGIVVVSGMSVRMEG